jgi:ribosome-associated protein
MKPAETRKQVLMAVEAAHAKQAQDVAVLELPQESSAFTDYFVVCSGSNPRQVQAICDEIDERLSKAGIEPNHREGYDQAEWVLLDYVDFVIHAFSENARKFYDLERLWKAATHVTEADLRSTRKTPAKVAAGKTAGGKKALPAKKATRRTTNPVKAAGKKSAKKVVTKKTTSTRTAAKAAARNRTKKR